MNLETFHQWLRGALPLRASDIIAEIQLTRRAIPSAATDLPIDAVELMVALRDLDRQKLVEKRSDELWYWKAEQPKAEPQLTMF